MAAVAWAFATVNHRDSALMEALGALVVQGLGAEAEVAVEVPGSNAVGALAAANATDSVAAASDMQHPSIADTVADKQSILTAYDASGPEPPGSASGHNTGQQYGQRPAPQDNGWASQAHHPPAAFPGYTAQQIVDIAWSYAVQQKYSAQLFNAIADHALRNLQRFCGAELSVLLWSLAKVRHLDVQLMKQAALRISQQVGVAPDGSAPTAAAAAMQAASPSQQPVLGLGCAPQASTAQSEATSTSHNVQSGYAAADAAAGQFWTPSQLAQTAWAYSQFPATLHRHRPLISLMLQRLLNCTDLLDPGELADVCWAAAALGAVTPLHHSNVAAGPYSSFENDPASRQPSIAAQVWSNPEAAEAGASTVGSTSSSPAARQQLQRSLQQWRVADFETSDLFKLFESHVMRSHQLTRAADHVSCGPDGGPPDLTLQLPASLLTGCHRAYEKCVKAAVNGRFRKAVVQAAGDLGGWRVVDAAGLSAVAAQLYPAAGSHPPLNGGESSQPESSAAQVRAIVKLLKQDVLLEHPQRRKFCILQLLPPLEVARGRAGGSETVWPNWKRLLYQGLGLTVVMMAQDSWRQQLMTLVAGGSATPLAPQQIQLMEPHSATGSSKDL